MDFQPANPFCHGNINLAMLVLQSSPPTDRFHELSTLRTTGRIRLLVIVPRLWRTNES